MVQLSFDGIASVEYAAIPKQAAFAVAQQAVAPLQQPLGRERRQQLPLALQLPLPFLQVALQQPAPLLLPEFGIPITECTRQPLLDAAAPMVSTLFQKAQQNPKIMAALQDVQANGPGAMSKYANDPEIMSVVKELQSIIG